MKWPKIVGNAYSLSRYLYKAIVVSEDRTIAKDLPKVISEGIQFEPDENSKGGVIIFSTEVNAVKQSENKIINWLKKKVKTIKNRFTAEKKLDKIAQAHDLVGWTVGKFLHGRYTGKNGKVYDENSISVELIGISSDELIKIAEEVCRAFDQEAVLVKDYSKQKVLFVDGE